MSIEDHRLGDYTLANVPPFPEMLNVEVTTACQLHCTFCPRDDMTREHGEMDLALFRRIADECKDHGTRLWLHFMGDPLLHTGIYEMLAYAREIGVDGVGMSTNTILLTKDACRKLIATGLDRLEFSVDSLDAEGYFRVRASKGFDKVVTNVRNFFAVRKEMGTDSPVATLSFMATPENQANWPAITKMWKPYLEGEDFIMSIDVHSFAGAMEEGPESVGANSRKPCHALWRAGLVLWNGDVTICGQDSDGKAVLGNLADHSLEEIWHSTALNKLRRQHIDNEIPSDSLCSGCDDWSRLQEGYNKVDLKV